MTTTTTGAELLRAILEDPASDDRRLIYADWLDDQGEAERSEFIRVQVTLASKTLMRHRSDGPSLRRRERVLLDSGIGPKIVGDRWHLFATDGALVGVFRRGFVDEVRCSLADWLGAECAACDGIGKRSHPTIGGGFISTACDKCFGTGRIGAHGPAIVAAQPITRVVLSDVEPIGPIQGGPNIGQWFWERRDVSEELWPWFFGGVAPKHMVTTHSKPTREAAIEHYGAACLLWARSAANLPPLRSMGIPIDAKSPATAG